MTTHDIDLLEGAGYEITLNVLTADSVPATVEEHEVYGALECCGRRMPFSVSPTGEAGQWLVTIPQVLISGALALSYQIFVRRRATGHEWLVLSGTVRLRHRYASAGDALATPPLHASATLSADSAALTVTELHGVRGERGLSTYDIAVREGFVGTEAEWLASLKAEYASEAVAAVAPLATAAESSAATASIAQAAAQASADDASDAAMTASERMADAESAARTASAQATEASASAAAAKKGAQTAQEAAQAARIAAEQAAVKAAHYIDLTGWDGSAGMCMKTADGWFVDELTVKMDNIKAQPCLYFKKMREMFGVSESLKKIYVYSDGGAFYNWIFSECKAACPNVKVMVYRAENATKQGYDSWNIYQLNVDFLEYYAPNAVVGFNGVAYNNEIVKALKLNVKNITKFDGFRALKNNVVRQVLTSEETKANNIFYSKDGALRVAKVAGDFWERITQADSTFYGAKNLASLDMYPAALPVLNSAPNMFAGCELPGDYVVRLLASLPAYESGTHEIGLGVHVDHQTDEEVVSAIIAAEEKGWIVALQWNGTATAAAANTFAMRQPVYARLGEPDEEGRQTLDWGHYVTNAEENGYTEFASLEEAKEHFNIKDDEQ